MKSAHEPGAPLVVRTPGWVVALRLALVAAFCIRPFIPSSALNPAETAVVWLSFAFGCGLLSYRVRDRLTVGEDGITAEWSPLSLGPIPLVRRRAVVPWSGVLAVEERPVEFSTMYVASLRVDGRRVGLGLVTGTKHKHAALARIVRRASRASVGLNVRDLVWRWEAEQEIAPPPRLAKGIGGRMRRVR